MKLSVLARSRVNLHKMLCEDTLTVDSAGIVSNADKDNKASRNIAEHIGKMLGARKETSKAKGQTLGKNFESHVCTFLRSVWPDLAELRPGKWLITPELDDRKNGIAAFDQYSHLEDLEKLAEANPKLKASIGADYLIRPDIVIARAPLADDTINAKTHFVGVHEALMTSLRASNQNKLLIHASVSCKWTIRSDRSQNSRSEALNLIRNRKGRAPHIVVVTGEPLPSRLASIALGTGDIDCVYHFALTELVNAVNDLNLDDASDMLNTLIEGKRLRDIADLPFDLVV